ncbi:MAG: triose-phosphate isomerase [Gammaproteobacteria bacterium]|nr:triose-phosphate isomerase [Gammaproteobacteria bacterium]
MRKPLVAGNWKMNGTRASARELASALSEASPRLAGIDVAVCPPYPHLDGVATAIASGALLLGAQDACEFADGAYTGEVSTAMLRELGCELVILGHSERRHVFGETDQRIAAKYRAVLQGGLQPILCVGETIEQRRAGVTETIVGAQLDAALAGATAAELHRTVIAYEPVWAIGTGETATPEQAQQVHVFIRARLARMAAAGVRILYGGSVKPDNAAALFAMPDVDGGLIGGASLKAKDFIAICAAAAARVGGNG